MRRLLQWNGQEERLSKETKRSCGMWSQHSFSTSGKCIRERRQTVSLSISFSFAGIIAPIVVQISFQNHKWNHWNPIRKWMSWDATSAVWQEVYHCASKIYLLWIFIKTKFFSCSDVHMGNYRGFSVCNVFSWRWQIIWQILSAAPVSLHLHSSVECAGVSKKVWQFPCQPLASSFLWECGLGGNFSSVSDDEVGNRRKHCFVFLIS